MSNLAFAAPPLRMFSSYSSDPVTPELEYAESPVWTSEEELDTPSTTPDTLELPVRDCFSFTPTPREPSLAESLARYYQLQYCERKHIQREESVLDFVQSVYKFTTHDIPFRVGGYRLPKGPLNDYLGSSARSKGRWGIHHTFTQLLQSVLDEFTENYRIVNGRFSVTKPLNIGDTPLPPIVWSTLDNPNEAHFDFLALFVEVSKSGAQRLLDSDLPVDIDMFAEDDEIVYEVRKLRSSKPLSDLEAKAVTSLNGLMSFGIRGFTTGIQVVDTNICLWYGDRFGVKKTATFNFLQQPHLLVLILAAIANASFEELGYSSCMRVRSEDFVLRSFKDYNRTSLVLDNAKGPDGANIGQQWFDLDVDAYEERNVFTQYGALGRGTTVVPVKKVRTLGSSPLEDEDLVAKLCWPYDKTNEDGTVRTIRSLLRSAPGYLKHIVDIKCTLEQSMEEAELPRVFMLDENDDESGRTFKVIVMKAYLPLEHINDPNDFKKVWRDVVVAHNYIYHCTKYLHRDISPTNIMFYIENGTAIGVLCDWELAEKRLSGQVFKSRRCGTPTFMAIDMLASDRPEHEYRHDLESFYWVLVWFIITHNPITRECADINEWSFDGQPGALSDIAMNKAEFIDVHQGFDPDLMTFIQPCYVQLIPMITSLASLFLAERLMTFRDPQRRRGMFGLSAASEEALYTHFWGTDDALQTLGGLRVEYPMFMQAVEDAW
ncbi:hypothetical protein QCA50_006747 [Cerrena zonata]|uniref:Protein kinase domain-containing protein n=1 Tax=Cerrena zonata TaxID=2478898 RepID=A0AAW0GB68_9APHY